MIINELLDLKLQMALYSYKKAPVKIHKVEKKKSRGITIASVLDKIALTIYNKMSAVKPLTVFIPFAFILSGIAILFGQIKPYALHLLQTTFSDKLDQEIITLVPDSYEEIRSEYISNPGAEYFNELLTETENDNASRINFEGTFYLTIEAIDIHNAPVQANVDSSNEEIYQEALSDSLAHFRGTKLPGEKGNVLVYGHSAAGDYAERNPWDLVTAFTRLFKLNIGDKIKINFQDQEYTYIIKKVKEVNPEDTEILDPHMSGKNLTLMTCSPPGLNSHRLIVVAVEK